MLLGKPVLASRNVKDTSATAWTTIEYSCLRFKYSIHLFRGTVFKGIWLPTIAPTICGNGDFCANKPMFRVSSSSDSGNFIN